MKETASLPAGFDALYYAHRNPSFFERVKHKLSKNKPDVFKYKIIVENKKGGSGVIGLTYAAKGVAKDGYTLGATSYSMVSKPVLIPGATFETEDFIVFIEDC